LLRSLGIEFTDLPTRISLQAFRGEALIVGPGAISGPRENFFPLLGAAGVRAAVILEQSALPGDLPWPLKLARPILLGDGRVFSVAPGHPVLDGLEGEDCWPSAPEVFPLLKPARGPCRSLLNFLPRFPEKGGAFSLLLECLPGRTKFIFCQLPLVSACGRDPAADRILIELFRWLYSPADEPEPVFVVSGPGQEEADFCREMGLPESRSLLPPGAGRRAMVFAGRETAEYLSGRESELVPALEELVASGGRLLLLGLEPETLALWRPLLPAGLELRECPPGAGRAECPLSWGISQSEWEECFARASESPGLRLYQPLLPGGAGDLHPVAPPLVWKTDLGRGAVVICQFPFQRFYRDETVGAVAARFLTNLGFALQPGPAE
jgi:hypothetical protein